MVSAKSLTSPVAVLTGPTASGKTELALRMAALLGDRLELVNADSMQVYRGMDIGTAKPTPEELKRVPHHLIDVRDPHQTYTAGEFRRETLAAVSDIHSRGKRALIVGGTGFYLKALFFGIWDGPPASPEVRARLEAMETPALFERLQQVDAVSANRIGPTDRYRLVRALEIVEQSGKTPTQLENEMSGRPEPGLELWIVDRTPQDLEQRLKTRAGQMIEQGFIEEVRALCQRYPQDRPRALGAVGYKEVCAYLDGIAPEGRRIPPGLPGLLQEIELATRQLVKKQKTWFKNLSGRLGPSAKSFELPGNDWRTDFERVYGP